MKQILFFLLILLAASCSKEVGPVNTPINTGPTGPKYGDLVFAVGFAYPVNQANSHPVVHMIYINDVHKATLANRRKVTPSCTDLDNTLKINLEEGEYKYRTVVSQGSVIYYESPVRTIRVTGGTCAAQHL